MPITIIAALILGQPQKYEISADGVPKRSLMCVEAALKKGVDTVEGYFGTRFDRRFRVVLAASRAAFDNEAKRRWKMPPSEKWMVGAGTADVLLILSPDRWKAEAVEHDGDSDQEVGEIIAHELVHVYHGQVCPNHDFEGMDDMAWFAEGLAVWVSGQLVSKHKGVAEAAVRDGRVPKNLSEAWSGKDRYGVSGSMVKYVEANWGKKKLAELLKATSNKDALKILNLSEGAFIRTWHLWVAKDQ